MKVVDAVAHAYRAAAAPFGRRALARAQGSGLPAACIPALRHLFGEPLGADEAQAAATIEAMRAGIARSTMRFHTLDTRRGSVERSGRDIAYRSSVSPIWGAVLMRLVRASNARAILELGSCAGISTCYLAAGSAGRVVGVEGDVDLATLAGMHVHRISATARVLHARFDDVLHRLDAEIDRPDFVYIDGEHTRRARLHYFDRVSPHVDAGAVVVFDDVHLTDDLWSAWTELRRAPCVGSSVTLGRFGVCVIGERQPDADFDFSGFTGWLRVGGRWKRATA